jgi:hypothetical protein
MRGSLIEHDVGRVGSTKGNINHLVCRVRKKIMEAGTTISKYHVIRKLCCRAACKGGKGEREKKKKREREKSGRKKETIVRNCEGSAAQLLDEHHNVPGVREV